METAQTVQKTVRIHADLSTVWKALTDPRKMRLWMSEKPIEIISGWKAGSSISIHGKMEQFAYATKGTILKWIPDEAFHYSYWNEISAMPDVPENYSVLEFNLSQQETITTVDFKQSNFKGEATYEHAKFFWNVALEVMKKMIEDKAF